MSSQTKKTDIEFHFACIPFNLNNEISIATNHLTIVQKLFSSSSVCALVCQHLVHSIPSLTLLLSTTVVLRRSQQYEYAIAPYDFLFPIDFRVNETDKKRWRKIHLKCWQNWKSNTTKMIWSNAHKIARHSEIDSARSKVWTIRIIEFTVPHLESTITPKTLSGFSLYQRIKPRTELFRKFGESVDLR